MTDLNQFVQDAIRTESQIETIEVNEHLFTGVMRTLIAAGNILDMIKKDTFYGKEMDPRRFGSLMLDLQTGYDEINHMPDPKITLDVDPRLFHAVVGIATESTELLEALEKIIGGEDPDSVNILEELGDVNWYEAIAIDTLDADFEKVLNTVIAKLKARFPEKFTSEDAINRDLATERKILEG